MSIAHAPEASAPKLRVLFVCTHNAVRSPMAHALCAARYGASVDCASVGVHVGDGVDPRAIAALEEIGVPLKERRPRGFADLERAGGDLLAFDVVVALSQVAFDGARNAARGADIEIEFWPIDDPTIQDDDGAHRTVRDALAHRIEERFGPATPA